MGASAASADVPQRLRDAALALSFPDLGFQVERIAATPLSGQTFLQARSI
jgi:hypothetical protein